MTLMVLCMTWKKKQQKNRRRAQCLSHCFTAIFYVPVLNHVAASKYVTGWEHHHAIDMVVAANRNELFNMKL